MLHRKSAHRARERATNAKTNGNRHTARREHNQERRMRATQLVLRVAVMITAVAMIRATTPSVGAAAQTDQRFYPESGYRVDNDQIWSYFSQKGGPRSFGYPISRTFRLFGLPTQIFQRHVMQVDPQAGVVVVNLVDAQWMPYTTIGWTAVPPYDQSLTSTAPAPGSADWVDDMLAYVKAALPDTFEGAPTNFYQTFAQTIAAYDPSITDPTAQAIAVLQNLDVWGIPVSRAMRDPGNPGDIVVRLERGIFRFRTSCSCTEPLPLGAAFKGLITGSELLADLEQQRKDSPFLRQYDLETHTGPYRAWELHETDLHYAFLQSNVPPYAYELEPPAPSGSERPLIAPTSTSIVRPTNTPVPAATNTPVPVKTNTPVPVKTNTPVPVKTNTPVPVDGAPAAASNEPAPATVGSPIAKQPYEIVLQQAEAGRELTLTGSGSGDDGNAAWTWIRWERDRTPEQAGLGPYVIVSKVIVAKNVETAKAIYGNEVAVRNFPEALDRFGAFFFLPRPAQAEEDQALASCFEEGCNATRYDIHLRLVFRNQNVVSIFYSYGDQLTSSLPEMLLVTRNVVNRMAS
jgi:hypothetical protein